MSKTISLALLLALSACAGAPPRQLDASPSACAISEASYECQVERYQNVDVN